MSVYSATKHAIVGFSLALREEARAYGVNVSVVCPSFIRSNIDENSARILRGTAEASAASKGSHSLDATKLARAILRGVSRKRAVIIMPAWVRVFWWLNRASPWLFSVLQYSVIMRRMHRKQRSRLGSIVLAPARWLFRLLVGGGRKR
jgi:short-subunit dehydrogenase